MKKVYWLRRFTLLVAMFGVGAAATNAMPTWIKVALCCGVGGYLLLMAEFEFDLRNKASER